MVPSKMLNAENRCRMELSLPQSASDRNQIIDYTLQSKSVKNRTDRDHEPNSLARYNLRHSVQLRWTIRVSTVTVT